MKKHGNARGWMANTFDTHRRTFDTYKTYIESYYSSKVKNNGYTETFGKTSNAHAFVVVVIVVHVAVVVQWLVLPLLLLSSL